MRVPANSWRVWIVPALLIVSSGLIGSIGCGGNPEAGSDASAAAQQADSSEEEKPAEDAIAVEVSRVGRASLSSIYSTSATLRADKLATITARTRGVLRKLLVEEGDWVDAEQVVAILEDDEQRIAFEQASAVAETKQREFERAKTLHDQGLLSEEVFETARREAVEMGHAAELAELTLSRTRIRATFAGRILTRHLDVGATVNDGTEVYDIADLSPLYADVQIPERQIAQLKPRQTVRLWTDSDEPAGEAVIERIAPVVDASTGTVKVTVAVRRAQELRPGSFIRVGIVTDTHENALVVPRSALVAEGRRWHVFRLKDDSGNSVELVEVSRGFEEGDRVEIIGTAGKMRPLDEGDRIVVTGASSLSDDAVVQILDEAGASSEEQRVAT